MKIKSFETALSTMKMITVPEWERYANHSCADYVAQGKTFTYNKMDRLKDMNYNDVDKETRDSKLPLQESVENDPISDNAVQGNESDNTVEFVNHSDAAAMNSEGENGSLLQNIQEELPSFSAGGTQTDNNIINRATFGMQTDDYTNTRETQTSIRNPMRSIETDTRDLTYNASTQTGRRNPVKTAETQTDQFTAEAPVQVNSLIKNPFKCPTCGKGLSTYFSLQRHRSKIHKENITSQTDKKIKEMQKKNLNCKTAPPPPPSKGPSNFLKPHRPTKTMKAVVKIKKLLLPAPSSKKLFYPSPTKGPSNLLKPHRPTKTMKAVVKIRKLLPPPPKKTTRVLKRKGGHLLFEKAPEDVINFKRRNIKFSPGNVKQVAGVKRKFNLDESEDENEENAPNPTKRRQTRSSTRNSNDQFGGGF